MRVRVEKEVGWEEVVAVVVGVMEVILLNGVEGVKNGHDVKLIWNVEWDAIGGEYY